MNDGPPCRHPQWRAQRAMMGRNWWQQNPAAWQWPFCSTQTAKKRTDMLRVRNHELRVGLPAKRGGSTRERTGTQHSAAARARGQQLENAVAVWDSDGPEVRAHQTALEQKTRKSGRFSGRAVGGVFKSSSTATRSVLLVSMRNVRSRHWSWKGLDAWKSAKDTQLRHTHEFGDRDYAVALFASLPLVTAKLNKVPPVSTSFLYARCAFTVHPCCNDPLIGRCASLDLRVSWRPMTAMIKVCIV